MRYNLYVFIISYFLINYVIGSDKGSGNKTVFIPTTEWKIVKKGTPIPKGLHVRHNFQTGITEAKLMDPDDTNNMNDETHKSLVLHPDAPTEDEKLFDNNDVKIKFQQDDKSEKISAGELKAKLKEIKLSKAPFASKAESSSINELKKKFQNTNFGRSADLDLLSNFIEQFNIHKNSIISGSLNSEEVKIIMDILSQLEYMVHDIDNGLEFTRSGGLSKVIYPCLNGTIEEIKLEALHVLGAAVQSNPKVKEAALELEFVPSILRTLTKSGISQKLMDRCIYALGSLVRNYPAAQKVFLTHGGLEIFSQFLAEGPMSTQKRIINLINDLIIERHQLNEIHDSIDRDSKIREYADVELEEKIIEHKFCTQLSGLLIKRTKSDVSTSEFNLADHDLLESIYQCLLTVSKICKSEFEQRENQILHALNEISNFYNNSNQGLYSEDEIDLLRNLMTLVNRIQKNIFHKLHDEL